MATALSHITAQVASPRDSDSCYRRERAVSWFSRPEGDTEVSIARRLAIHFSSDNLSGTSKYASLRLEDVNRRFPYGCLVTTSPQS